MADQEEIYEEEVGEEVYEEEGDGAGGEEYGGDAEVSYFTSATWLPAWLNYTC